MTLEQCYAQLHGDLNEAKQRLMNEKLIGRFLLKFLNDPTMEQLRAAVAAGSHEDAFRAAHTMKGVAGNLAFTELQQAASELTEQLRNSTDPADPVLFARVEACYQKVSDTIAVYQREL